MGIKPHIKYEYKGKLMTVSELMSFSAVSKNAFRKRVANGWTIQDALNIPQVKVGGDRQKNCEPATINIDAGNYIDKRYRSKITEESTKKAETNKKLEKLIEKRRLKDDLDDLW